MMNTNLIFERIQSHRFFAERNFPDLQPLTKDNRNRKAEKILVMSIRTRPRGGTAVNYCKSHKQSAGDEPWYLQATCFKK